MLLAPLFPLAPSFWALLLLQLVNGAAVGFAWSGAQTLIAQLAEGDARYIGRFSFFARLGSTSAPIVAGAVWDFGGAWPAYLLGTAWGAVLTATLLRTPEAASFLPQLGFRHQPAAVPGPRHLAPPLRLSQLDPADRDPRGGGVDGRHHDAQHDLQPADLGLCRLSRPDRAGRHDDRPPVRRLGDRERVRLAVRRPGDAARKPAAHDAERHRVLDPADRGDAAAWAACSACSCCFSSRAAGSKG